MKTRSIVSALLLGGCGLLAGCQTVETTSAGAVGVDRKQHMLVSSEQVDQAAVQAYEEQLKAARDKGALNKNSATVARVRGIANRLIPQTGVFRQDAPGWKWEVNVETSNDLNAYCMPGGKIMVYTGLIEKLDLSDSELAAVVGHEIAHALREHSRERMSRAYAQQLALAGVATIAGLGEGATSLASMVADVTFQLPHSREQEAEADRIGLELMARAGYDPNAAPNVWRKMAKQENSGGPPEFLSTHPSGSSRIADLEKNVPKVMPLYNAAAKR